MTHDPIIIKRDWPFFAAWAIGMAFVAYIFIITGKEIGQ